MMTHEAGQKTSLRCRRKADAGVGTWPEALTLRSAGRERSAGVAATGNWLH